MSVELRPGYKKTEVGVIPDDWAPKSIKQISDPVRGGSPRPAGDSRFFNGTYIPWLTVAALTNIPESQLVVTETATCLTEEGSLRSRTLLPGTLIIANSGATLGVAKILGVKCCANDGIAALLNVDKSVSVKYLAHFINTKTTYLRDVVATGNGQPNLNTGLIGDFNIPIPPTKGEQEAIAEVLSDTDSLIESLEQLVAKKRHLKQGTMQELLTGKKRLPGFNGECSLRKLSDMATLSKAGLNPAATPEVLFTHFSLPAFDYGAIPVVELGGYIGSNKFLVPAGAVLLSKLNPRIPRVWAPSYIPDNAVCSTEFLVLVPRESTNRVFLAALCQSPAVCYQMELHAIGTTGSHQRIHPGQALAIEVYVPTDNAEQTAIADILSDMDAEISDLEAQLAKTRTLKQGMMQKLLTGEIRLI